MQRGHGVVYTIAPALLAAGQIWAGTDTGLIQLTRDNGKTWTNVTPQGLAVWSKVSLLDAGHFAAGTAYAAIDRHRINDITPYIYRTHDFGKTWTRINSGIPEGAYVRAVREDPVRQGLLFAGTELGVFFSLNDGDSWQPLQLNLPASPVHDLVIKGNDLVIATHGRSFWIMDDISPLRQIKADITTQPTTLFKPADAIRMRASTNHDTPLSPEVPAGENPPTGAVFYYSLNTPAQGEVKIEVLDSAGHVIRSYSSNDKPWSPTAPPAFASYWFGPTGESLPGPGCIVWYGTCITRRRGWHQWAQTRSTACQRSSARTWAMSPKACRPFPETIRCGSLRTARLNANIQADHGSARKGRHARSSKTVCS